MPFDEDLDVFFRLDEHGTAATVGGVAVVGIFERPYAEVLEMGTRRPSFLCKEADARVAIGDVIVISGASWKIVTREPDGAGLVQMELELQEPAAGEGVSFPLNQPMIEAPPDTKQNDHALLKIGDTYHLIGITCPVSLQGSKYFSHYTSPDLRTWTRGADLEIGTGVTDNWRCQVWAPFIMANPGYGGGGALAAYKWLMFFTGASKPAVHIQLLQKIGLAGCEDDDLNDWTILNGDAPIYWTGMDDTGNGGSYSGGAPWSTYGVDWVNDSRDPHVFTDGSDYYLMVMCSSSTPPGTAYKAIGLAKFNGGMAPEFAALTHCGDPLLVSSHTVGSYCESSFILVKGGLYHLWTKKSSGMRHESDDDFMGPPWAPSPYVGTLFLRSTKGPGNATSCELCQIEGDTYAISGHVQATPYWYKINLVDFSEVAEPGDTPSEAAGAGVAGLRGLVAGVLDDDLGWHIGDSEGYYSAFYLQPVWGDQAAAAGYGPSGMTGNSYLATHFKRYYPGGYAEGAEWDDYSRVGWIYSDPFTLTKSRMELMVGGGEYANTEFVALVRAADGAVLHKATGNGNHVMRKVVWDLTELIGTEVFLVIADLETAEMGCIAVDAIREYTPAAHAAEATAPVPPVTADHQDIVDLLGGEVPWP